MPIIGEYRLALRTAARTLVARMPLQWRFLPQFGLHDALEEADAVDLLVPEQQRRYPVPVGLRQDQLSTRVPPPGYARADVPRLRADAVYADLACRGVLIPLPLSPQRAPQAILVETAA